MNVDRKHTVNHYDTISMSVTQGRLETYLSIVHLARTEQRIQRVVARDDEAGNVDEEGAANVKEDQEEVQGRETQDDVDLGDRGLLLEIVEGGVFRQLDKAQDKLAERSQWLW